MQERQDDFSLALKTILPQIERQLMKDIQRQLEFEFEDKYLKAIDQINQQAVQEYQYAVKELEESRQLLQEEKQQEVRKQIAHLQSILAKFTQERMVKLQQKFLEENFQSRVMTHPSIVELEHQIQQEIYDLLEEKHQATKQRQLKELIIAHETKQIKLRKQLDLQIKSRIYSSSGLQELRQEIKTSKTQMGSQKSQYNLKLRKIQAQIKQYTDKIKQIQRMGDVQKLRQKYQELKIQSIQDETERGINQNFKDNTQQHYKRQPNQPFEQQNQNDIDQAQDKDSLDKHYQFQPAPNHNGRSNSMHHQKKQNPIRGLRRQQKNGLSLNGLSINGLSINGAQFINNNVSVKDDEQEDSCNQNFIQSQNSSNNSKKINLTAYFKDYLLSSHTAKITESQNIVPPRTDQNTKQSLLNLSNVCEMLKQKIASDPLERYLNKESVSKQNDVNVQNINYGNSGKSSNFAEIYEQHLKNLNKGHGKKKDMTGTKNSKTITGLSVMAKKTIIRNLTQYHRETFYKNDDKIINLNSVNQTGNYNTHETNLLASEK